MKKLIKSISQQIVDTHEGDNWIGVNYFKLINPLSDKEFFYSSDESHSVAEIISHLTVWRNETLLKMKTGEGSITDDHPSNWKNNSELKALGKFGIMNAYQESLNSFLRLLKEKDDDFLKDSYFDTDFKDYYPFSFLIYGMLHHDLYHLGQLGMVIKTMNSKTDSF